MSAENDDEDMSMADDFLEGGAGRSAKKSHVDTDKLEKLRQQLEKQKKTGRQNRHVIKRENSDELLHPSHMQERASSFAPKDASQHRKKRIKTVNDSQFSNQEDAAAATSGMAAGL